MTNLEQLKTELYNIAKPLRSSNNHAPSETLIENEIMMINHMRKKSEYGRTGNQIADYDQQILSWKWALSSCKELRREINDIEAA